MPGIDLGDSKKTMNAFGPIHRIGDAAIERIGSGNFGFPERFPVSWQNTRGGLIPAIIILDVIMIRENTDHWRHIGIVHRRGVKSRVARPNITLRNDDSCL